MKRLLLIASYMASAAIVCRAQATSSANQNVALSLSNAIAITFVATGTTTGNTVTIPFNTVSDYANASENSTNQPQVKVQSNKSFNVTVNAASTNFTYSGTTSPAPVMPVSDILAMQVFDNNTGGTIATPFLDNEAANITASSATIISSGHAGSNQTFSLEYEANPGFAYPAGTYTINLVFTAT